MKKVLRAFGNVGIVLGYFAFLVGAIWISNVLSGPVKGLSDEEYLNRFRIGFTRESIEKELFAPERCQPELVNNIGNMCFYKLPGNDSRVWVIYNPDTTAYAHGLLSSN